MKIEDLKLDNDDNITIICYKPEWTIKFSDISDTRCHGHYEIRCMHRDQPDASKFKKDNDYFNYLDSYLNPILNINMISYDLFSRMDEKEFYYFIYDCIRRLEDHEIKEWFKIKGQYFKNPHPGVIADSECFLLS